LPKFKFYWSKSPKIETETLNVPLAASISSISPVRLKKGPSKILTTSPTVN
jgi:hypothetical protein